MNNHDYRECCFCSQPFSSLDIEQHVRDHHAGLVTTILDNDVDPAQRPSFDAAIANFVSRCEPTLQGPLPDLRAAVAPVLARDRYGFVNRAKLAAADPVMTGSGGEYRLEEINMLMGVIKSKFCDDCDFEQEEFIMALGVLCYHTNASEQATDRGWVEIIVTPQTLGYTATVNVVPETRQVKWDEIGNAWSSALSAIGRDFTWRRIAKYFDELWYGVAQTARAFADFRARGTPTTRTLGIPPAKFADVAHWRVNAKGEVGPDAAAKRAYTVAIGKQQTRAPLMINTRPVSETASDYDIHAANLENMRSKT